MRVCVCGWNDKLRNTERMMFECNIQVYPSSTASNSSPFSFGSFLVSFRRFFWCFLPSSPSSSLPVSRALSTVASFLGKADGMCSLPMSAVSEGMGDERMGDVEVGGSGGGGEIRRGKVAGSFQCMYLQRPSTDESRTKQS